jgi:hypothetical protein
MLGSAERQLLVDWNDTRADYPGRNAFMNDRGARSDPDATALVFEARR